MVHNKTTITAALVPLIDTVSDPLNRHMQPTDYARAMRDLVVLVSDPWVKRLLTEVRAGAKTNRAAHNIGPRRMAWLSDFMQESGL